MERRREMRINDELQSGRITRRFGIFEFLGIRLVLYHFNAKRKKDSSPRFFFFFHPNHDDEIKGGDVSSVVHSTSNSDLSFCLHPAGVLFHDRRETDPPFADFIGVLKCVLYLCENSTTPHQSNPPKEREE